MEELGIEDPAVLNQFFKEDAYSEEKEKMVDFLKLVKTLHPNWVGGSVEQHKLESQLRALQPPKQTTLDGKEMTPEQQRDAYRDASARALNSHLSSVELTDKNFLQPDKRIRVQAPPQTFPLPEAPGTQQGLPQPQPGQQQIENNPTFVTDIFGRRRTPGEQGTFAVPPNQQ